MAGLVVEPWSVLTDVQMAEAGCVETAERKCQWVENVSLGYKGHLQVPCFSVEACQDMADAFNQAREWREGEQAEPEKKTDRETVLEPPEEPVLH